MDLLYLSDHQTRLKPQKGTPCVLSWPQFVEWLSRPVRGQSKSEAGGYSPALYKENVRHLDKMVHVQALVFDIDVEGDVHKVAEKMKMYSCIVHETFSSTAEAPRCRLLVRLREPIEAPMYVVAHRKFRVDLTKLHVWADEHATDASRLSYCPVRLPGTEYKFVALDGEPLDAKALVALATQYKPHKFDLAPRHADDKHGFATVTKQYIESAIVSAQFNIEQAAEGSRHAVLIREALSLSRLELNLTFDQVEEALFDVALSRMGPTRTHEIRAAIRSGFEKMRNKS